MVMMKSMKYYIILAFLLLFLNIEDVRGSELWYTGTLSSGYTAEQYNNFGIPIKVILYVSAFSTFGTSSGGSCSTSVTASLWRDGVKLENQAQTIYSGYGSSSSYYYKDAILSFSSVISPGQRVKFNVTISTSCSSAGLTGPYSVYAVLAPRILDSKDKISYGKNVTFSIESAVTPSVTLQYGSYTKSGTYSNGIAVFDISDAPFTPGRIYNVIVTATGSGMSTSRTFRLFIIPPPSIPLYLNPFNLTPNSVFYNENILLNLTTYAGFINGITSLGYNSGVLVNCSNTTTTIVPLVNYTANIKLSEGRNWVSYVAYSSTTNNILFKSLQVPLVIDRYLPEAPIIQTPINGNYTSNVFNVSWSYNSLTYDIDSFLLKGWGYYPKEWSTVQVVPAAARWSFFAFPGSGRYYLSVIAKDAAGNEKASAPITINIASSDVIISNFTLNMTGFKFLFVNTVNESRDCYWNLTLRLLDGSLVERRVGLLNLYPFEKKNLTMTWQRNLTQNVYIAEIWLKDMFGKQTGYIKPFIAIPPIMALSELPLSTIAGSWESDMAGLNESVTLRSIYVITNSNPVESTSRILSIPLPNVSLSSVTVRNTVTGAEYPVAGFSNLTVNVTVPSIPPRSALIMSLKATTKGKILAFFNKTNAQPVFLSGNYWSIYNLTVVNQVNKDVRVRLTENSTLKFECPSCSISEGSLILNLKPLEKTYLKAYKLVKMNITSDIAARPLSTLLDFMSTTTTGIFISFIIGFMLPIAFIARRGS
ncbi:MAG: hypothetical protein QW506_04915 [Thermoproteota archaeon]